MAFLTLNGVTISVFRDAWREDPIFIGDTLNRSINGAMNESRTARKRRWSFSTPPLRSAYATKLRQWIEGLGQGWSFDNDEFSLGGVGQGISGTYSLSATTTKYVKHIVVDSGQEFGFTPAYVVGLPGGWTYASGWTIMFWVYLTLGNSEAASDGWYHVICHGAVSHDGSSANPASVTQYENGVADADKGRLFTVDTEAALRGKLAVSGDTSAAKNFDEFQFFPFQIDATWAPQIYAFASSYQLGMQPVLRMVCDAVEDASPVRVVGRIDGISQMNAAVNDGAGLGADVVTMDVSLHEV